MWYLIGINEDKSKQILYESIALDLIYNYSQGCDFTKTNFERVVIVSDVDSDDSVKPIYWQNPTKYSTELADILTIIKDALELMHNGKFIQSYQLLSDFYDDASRSVNNE